MAADDDMDESENGNTFDGSQSQPMQIPELTELDMLSNRIAELENNVSQYKDQLLRKAAEFENYKKRNESEAAALRKFYNEELLSKFLPVLDDFERSLKAAKTSGARGSENVFLRGLELIYQKLKKILEQEGVKHFEVVGKPFDPQLHDALMQVVRNDVPPHTVVEEVEKGYKLNDKVLRHSRVIVSADKPSTSQEDETERSSGPNGSNNDEQM